MLRLLKFPFFIVLIGYSVSCNREEPEIPDPDNGEVIQSITYHNGDQSQTHTMVYDDYGKLIAIQGFSNSGEKEFLYDSLDRISVILTYRLEEVIFKDSLSYNEQGKLAKNHMYIKNGEENLILNRIHYYYYDTTQRIKRRTSYSISSDSISWFEEFYWIGNNVKKREFYGGDGELRYEFIYQYDNKKNPKKDFPYFFADPMSQTENNITWDGFNDYYGNLDRFRNPFTYEYLYNSSDLPYQMKSNWDYSWTIDYE